MRILLIGYGKMGKEIELIAIERGHEIAGKIGSNNKSDLSLFNSSNTDAAIEFTQPESAFENISYCLQAGIPILSGTTGWLAKFEQIKSLCTSKNGAFLYASNYSIGVNLFFELNKTLAKLMSGQPYHLGIEEIHHTQKKDAPSGTAITLAEGIIANSNYKSWTMNSASKDEIKITSKRIDPAPGTHVITYDSDIDQIEIKHTAHSRKGFASGAVLVAEWIIGKKGVFEMKDFLNDLKK